ncbi:P-loop NTPase [Paraburkholderia bannensis]|uniref:P-loop NTPase n=1 Tax=Paraburkholderia bannensis TaxID=765414 RepID=UPI002AC329DC|nr:metallophosphoesterase [Paraburkholderia bannensis]
MSDFIKWLHLSDFHFGLHPFDQAFSAKKIVEHLKESQARGLTPDFIFITGDVANAGKKSEYEQFVEHLLSPIVDLFGNEFLDKIFTVPGNHDLNRHVNQEFSKEKFVRPESLSFNPDQGSAQRREILAKRFEDFFEHSLCESSTDIKSDSGAIVAERTINSAKVGIVGLNTAWLCDGEKDKEALTPGVSIVRDALESISGCAVKFVLGHHPLDWLYLPHRQAIQSLLAANQAIYLHGHMHTESFSNTLNGAGEFLTVQSGAGWQCPEGGKWKNGFMWGVADLHAGLVRFQPFSWSFANQCWALDGTRFHENYRNGDWWEIEAPRARTKPDYAPKQKNQRLVGWEIKDLTTLERSTKKLQEDESIAYFDGATPTWSIALSDSIPRREIVGKVAKNFRPDTATPYVCALLGAACEGKTTALLQSGLEILRVNKSKKVLFRTNHTRPFNGAELFETLRSHDDWLLIIDEADQVAKDILRFIDAGFDGYDGRIDFLLASRDSDWQSSGAKSLAWTFKAKFKEETLKDLSLRDADLIVKSWGNFGSKGLGEELALLPEDQRAEKLRFYAKKESKGNTDAFFGALLMSRHGNDLLEHAQSMLERLAEVELPNGLTLKDVLGYIAAMHVEGFDKLNFAALAGILELSIPKLQSEVLRQLGKEAAATSTSTSIFTRHKYIAAALIEVLETKFSEDISHYYIDLATSEVIRSKTEQVIDLAFWRFEMTEKLFLSGKTRLAIDIARKVYETDTSFHLVTKLASFYRRQGNADDAVQLFRNFGSNPSHRGFYFEWGVCEGILRHRSENALLAAYALSDQSETSSLMVENARIYLSGLSKCCDNLHIAFADRIFIDAESACNSLLTILKKNEKNGKSESEELISKFAKDVEKRRKNMFGRAEAIAIISDMVRNLAHYGIAPEVVRAADANSMSFMSLDRIIRNVEVL